VIDDPLGLAIALVVILGLALVGATLAPGGRGTRDRWRTRTIAAAVIAGAAIALVWRASRERHGVDLSPKLPALAAVAGDWRDGSDSVTFDGMGYRCRGVCTGLGPSGQWERLGRYGVVTRWTDGHVVTWRLVRYKGNLRLALLPLEGDVGSIDGRLYYTKVQ
jgi:hypothetical protein